MVFNTTYFKQIIYFSPSQIRFLTMDTVLDSQSKYEDTCRILKLCLAIYMRLVNRMRFRMARIVCRIAKVQMLPIRLLELGVVSIPALDDSLQNRRLIIEELRP